MNIASLQNQTQLEVACPLDGCRRGKFYIEGSIKEDSAMSGTVKSEKKSKHEEVINLESSDEEESDNKLDIKPAAVTSKRKVKQEVNAMTMKIPKRYSVKKEDDIFDIKPSADSSSSRFKIKRELVKKETPKRVSSPSRKNIKFVSPSGPSPKKKEVLKPVFKVGLFLHGRKRKIEWQLGFVQIGLWETFAILIGSG